MVTMQQESRLAASLGSTEGHCADCCSVPAGFDYWLQDLGLVKYATRAAAWVEELGVYDLLEVAENWHEFAEALVVLTPSLKP